MSQKILIAAGLSLALLGCATPRPVLDLASQGVAVTAKTEAELNEFVSRSDRLYDHRLASIRRLAAGNIEAAAATEFETFTAAMAGMRDEAEMTDLIRELSSRRAELREKASRERKELEKRLAPPRDAVRVPEEKLGEARRSFAVLSEELSREEWLAFALNYGKQVNELRKQARESADKAEAEGDRFGPEATE